MIIDFYKERQQKEKEYIEQLEIISEKMQDGIILADQIIDVLKQNKKLKEENEKAKEIIGEFIEWANWQGSKCPSFKSIQEKAEKFLSKL